MISPLSKGDKISLVAPGRKVSSIDMEASLAVFKQWGLQVSVGKHLFSNEHSYLSGTDLERIEDFQTALNDPAVRAIICARGGYGSGRIIDQLDFTIFKENPKWIVGFSDITCIHLACASLDIPSVHGAMPIQFSKPEATDSIKTLRKVLFGEPVKMVSAPNDHNLFGEVDAPLIGGNLSLLVDSLGTRYEINTVGKILMVEEIDEPRYKVDRMLMQLKRAGKLDRLAGIAIGQMTEIGDSTLPFEEKLEVIVGSKIASDIPLAFNLPFGHEHPNVAWVQGASARFRVDGSGAVLDIRHKKLDV